MAYPFHLGTWQPKHRWDSIRKERRRFWGGNSSQILISSPDWFSQLQLLPSHCLLSSTTSLSYWHLKLSLRGNKFLFLPPNPGSLFFPDFSKGSFFHHDGGCKLWNYLGHPLHLDFLFQLVPKNCWFFFSLTSPPLTHHFHSPRHSFSQAVAVAHGQLHFI